MDLKSFSYEQLIGRLGNRSNKELYKLAKGHNIELPPGLEKDAILRSMFEHIQGSEPTSAVESSAPSSHPPADVGPQIKGLSTTGRQYWRCGLKFTPNWSKPIPISTLTPSELDTLRKDKNLRIKDVPAPAAE